jgi:putative MATE family efflux protein
VRTNNNKHSKNTISVFQLHSTAQKSAEIDSLEGKVNGDHSNPKVEDISANNTTFTQSEEQNNDSKVQEMALESKSSKRKRFLAALPKISRRQLGDEADRQILSSSLPSMLNMAVVPLVNAVDTFWVGRLGIALALAGQAAANQAFFMFYFFVSVLPTITAPMVAKAVGSGDEEEAEKQVNQALFLSNFLGAIGTIILVGFPRQSLELILTKDAPSMSWAIPYLRFRGLSMIPALLSATGFSAYRGLMDTVTPLKVSLITNFLNLITDPLLIFGLSPFGVVGKLGQGLGVTGAAVATAGAELTSGLIYVKLLLGKKLMRWSKVFKVPSLTDLKPILQGAASMLIFQLSINVALTLAARRAQAMDPTGVMAAAYGKFM